MMKKKIFVIILAGILVLSLAACGGNSGAGQNGQAETQNEQGEQVNEQSVPLEESRDEAAPVSAPDLTGSWIDAESPEAESGWRMVISEDTMEVYLEVIQDDGVLPALYWAGSYTPPVDANEPYTWESQNDTDRTSGAIFGSEEAVKSFTYENGRISFEATAFGNTITAVVQRGEWSYNADFLTDMFFGGSSDSHSAEKMVGSGDLGAYHVEIKGASLARDYEDKPVIIITYTWTNNSEDTTSAMFSMMEKAFQDGVQLEGAYFIESEEYNSGNYSKEVRPGTSIDVQRAFILTSETSTVELEITESFSWTDDMVTMDFNPAELG